MLTFVCIIRINLIYFLMTMKQILRKMMFLTFVSVITMMLSIACSTDENYGTETEVSPGSVDMKY
jgi:hypothetical protein